MKEMRAGSRVRIRHTGESAVDVRVECDAGHRSEETPRRFWIGSRRLAVVEIMDRWIAPDHRYFKILADDGDIYILRHDPAAWRWELAFYRGASGLATSEPN